MQHVFRPTDRGKPVLDGQDERVGTITGVSGETACVRSDRDVDDLDGVTWTDDGGSFLIETDSIDSKDAEAVRLKRVSR